MVQMPFSQIQQAPGPDFRMVEKSLQTKWMYRLIRLSLLGRHAKLYILLRSGSFQSLKIPNLDQTIQQQYTTFPHVLPFNKEGKP